MWYELCFDVYDQLNTVTDASPLRHIDVDVQWKFISP